MLKAAASSTLFPCENHVSCWKEYFLKIIVFQVKKGSLCSKWAYSVELKRHLYIYEETQLWWSEEHLVHCFPVRIELVFERNTSYNYVFQGQIRLCFLQIELFNLVEETRVFPKKNI
jgi:hypothetical protein